MTFVEASPIVSPRSQAAIIPAIEPPVERSTNGYMPLKNVSPMWSTFAFRKYTIASPSVCAGGTWKASTSSPFTWNEMESTNVTSGSAAAGDGGTFESKALMNCSEDMRFLTLSWATMTTPVFPRFSLPPTWSPCQCVFRTKRMGLSETAATAALILSESGAYWLSIMKTPSAPAETPMLPPAPVSIQMPSASFSVLISTLLKSCWAKAGTDAQAARAAARTRLFLMG